MITVFTWAMSIKDPAGHASMKIGESYISWWPEHGRSDSGFGGVRGVSLLAWGGPSYVNTMSEDKKLKGRPPDYASAPINFLNEKDVIEWWEKIKPKNKVCSTTYNESENTYYDLARLSCATIVMRALLVGGAEKFSRPRIPVVATAAKGLLSGAGPVGQILGELVIGDAVSPLDVALYADAIAASNANHR